MPGFKTGLGFPTHLGRPYYYIESMPANIWDANTYVSIAFDASGSMNAIINPLKNAMGGAYCASGSAANNDCVKATDNLRAIVQDYYVTPGAGIEGAPDYNSNNATNGSLEFEKHVNFTCFGSTENTVAFMSTPLLYKAGSTWGVDNPDSSNSVAVPFSACLGGAAGGYEATNKSFSHPGFVTPSNFVQICVGNESHTSYHDHWSGANWDNTEYTATYQNHIQFLRHAIGGSSYSTTHAHGMNAGDPVSLQDRADGYKPSFTAVMIDPGLSGYHTSPDIVIDDGVTPASASQALWKDGIKGGNGAYALGGITANETFSLVDLDDHMAWNGRANKLTLTQLNNQSGNVSQTYWRDRLLEAFLANIIFP